MRPAFIAALVALGILLGTVAAQAPNPDGGPSASAQPAAPTHRPLRAPLPPMDALPEPTAPEVFRGIPDAPAYTVVPRKPELPLHPCSMCHNDRPLDTKPRTFVVAPPPDGAPHAGVLRHGGGRFWCLDCHMGKDREWLRTLDGAKLDFDESPVLCGQCHSARYRDWAFGAHGKRVAGWTGERQLYACTHCHDPHVPQIPHRDAGPPPPVRAGLSPMPAGHGHPPPLWLRVTEGASRDATPKP
jgi:hypothetical protein